MHGHLCQHVRPCNRVARGLRESSFEPPLVVPGIGDVTAFGEKQPGADARRPRGQGIDLAAEAGRSPAAALRQPRDTRRARANGRCARPAPAVSGEAHAQPARRRRCGQLAADAAPAAAATVAASSASGCSVASARCRARSSSSPTMAATSRWSSRRSCGRARLLAAAASSGWEGRTRSPSTRSSPASSASSMADGLCDRRESATGATPRSGRPPSSSLRTGFESASTRVPRRSSTVSGTGMSSPMAGDPCAARVRPSSRAKSGFPRVVSNSRRRTWRGRLSPRRSASIRRVAPRLSGPTSSRSSCRRASACSNAEGLPGRSASRNPTGSSSSRRAANVSASADGGSSHWTSSTATSSGPRAASARSAFRKPSAIAPVSGGDVGRLGAQERNLQRTQLRRRQRSQLLRAHTVEQIDQRREREPRLRPARPGRKDTQSLRPRGSHPRVPQRRLPDPRPAAQAREPREHRRRRRTPAGRRAHARGPRSAHQPARSPLRHSTHRTLFTSWIRARTQEYPKSRRPDSNRGPLHYE